MPRLLTLTLNPALDVFTTVDRVEPQHKLRCSSADLHPGGGGINVARVLHRLGADVEAVFPAGGVAGNTVQALLRAEGVPFRALPIAADTRESFSVHEQASGQDYRFVLPGPTLTPQELQACVDAVVATQADTLVLSGSLPPGAPDTLYAQVADAVRARGTRVVVDTSGAPLDLALGAGVYLIKPSLRELEHLAGRELANEADQLDAAQQCVRQGQADIVAVSLGADGAMLVTRDLALRASGLPVNVASTIGAGDSFVAGLVWALGDGQDLQSAFRAGMAAGTAALLSAGTALCDPRDIERLRHQVQIRTLAPGLRAAGAAPAGA